MKSNCIHATVIAMIGMIPANDAFASDWAYKHTRDPAVMQAFISQHHPKIDGVQCTLSGGKDFHCWIRKHDNNQNTLKMKIAPKGPAKALGKILAQDRAAVIGYTNKDELYYIEESTASN